MYHYDPLFPTFPSTPPPPPPPHPPPLHHPQEPSFSSSSSSLLPPQSPLLLQRTTRSLSFHHVASSGCSSYSYPMLENTTSELLDTHPGPMRRVCSTGDMDPLRVGGGDGDGGVVAAATGARVGRYNAEERRERIERYRSKRNHRNFQKKITYACRKTLADSRPRVRGRFARNGELEAEPEPMAFYNNYYGNGEMSSSGRYDWSGLGATGFVAPTMTAGCREEDEYCYDGELWTNFLDVFAMNNLVSE